MTTPAISTDVINRTNVTVRREYFNRDTGVYVFGFEYPATTTQSRGFRYRPKSISNPLRKDGTRAPSAWYHRQATVASPTRDVVVGFRSGSYDVVVSYLGTPGNPLLSGGDWRAWKDIGLGWTANVESFPYAAESIAVTKALTKLRQQKYDFGATLGELKETAGFVADACDDLVGFLSSAANKLPGDSDDVVRFIMSLNKSELKSARNQRYGPRVRSMANSIWGKRAEKYMELGISLWMAYQLAVKPLLYDIEDGRNALGEALFGDVPQPLRLKVRSSGRDQSYHKATWPSGFSFITSIETLVTNECKVSATYDVSPTKDSRAQQWGLTNSWSVLWELTTLSWMVDYLTNMGEWLGTLTPVEGASFVEGTITRFQYGVPSAAEALSPISGVEAISGFNRKMWSMDASRMERVLIPPYGLLPAVRPAFRNKLDLTRLANSLAGLTGQMRKYL